MNELETIIRQHVPLDPPSSLGWEACLHSCDHGRKGNRAAFKFEGDTTAFHCFNCPTKAIYDPNSEYALSDYMREVLKDFNIPDEAIQQIVFNDLKNKNANGKSNQLALKKKDVNEPKIIQQPDNFYLMSDAKKNDQWAEIAKHHLTKERHIDPDSYPFLLAKKSEEDPRLNKWRKRLIIPIFKNGNLIYYQGRDLSENSSRKKYESPAIPKNNIMYGFDKLFNHSHSPIFVVEGWFDAFVLDGVAILGNELSTSQIIWLNKSSREKIYIPDRFGSGSHVAKVALNEGWSISTPDIGSGSQIKDMSDAVVKYGKLYTINTIYENTAKGFAGELKIKTYCEK